VATEEQDTQADAGPPVDDVERGLLGMDVGGYTIDGELGRGGMGVVYAATHPMIGKRAAIKVLKPSLSKNPATVERFLQEARSVNQIGHPNIVDIFAFGSLPDGRRYLVMDLLEGESLRTRVKRGPLHVREAATVLDEIASALIAAHDKGFVHRDLKPDNLFLVAHPGRTDVKLLDFGLAKLLPNAPSARAFRTATGAQLGTPDYMSPEQLRGAGVDARTDIFALGVVAFEILTGRRPRRFSDGRFDVAPAQALAFAPAELAQLVETMLAHDAEQRPSLAAVRTVIQRVLPALPPLSIATPPMPAPRASEPELDSLTASKVGAAPVLATPPRGAPAISSPAMPAATSSSAMPAATSSSAMPAAISSPALRPAAVPSGSTRLGVPPPPVRVSRPQSAAPPVPARENRTWLILGALLVIAAGVALAIVLAP
jgi:serine/threonine-protein kinase